MKCRLCLKEKSLIKKSHIIPDFLYKDMFDEKHRLVFATLVNIKEMKFFQTGIYEKDLFCQECESEVLGELEKYSSKILFNNNLPKNQQVIVERGILPDGLKLMRVSNINYQKFKLFLLSILWRASLSKHKIFSQVDLQDKESLIREIIIDNKNLPEDSFRVCILLYSDNFNNSLAKILLKPKRIGNLDEPHYYIFFINHFFYLFEIIKDDRLPWFDVGNIKINNTIEIPIIDYNFFQQFIERLYK